MKKLDHRTLFANLLKFGAAVTLLLACGTAMGQEEKDDEFTLEEITVTAQFTETNLQKTPISITAVTGESLEKQNILNVKDLGLIVPNAVIKEMGNAYGPNTSVFLRGVGYADFIPATEPGVGIYVDDVYVETLVSSMMDLVDIERIEVLNGPQGTLSGKNNLGGSIKIISKVPTGSNTGHLSVTYGDYDRLDFNAGYDFSVIDNVLFARLSASSKKIDGYMDVLDFTCQMKANGTPEKAGSFPSQIRDNKSERGDCKIGEKGGRESDAAKLVLRYIPTDKLEFNFGIDYTEATADPSAETLLKGLNPDASAPANIFNTITQTTVIDPLYNLKPGDNFTILGDTFVTGNPFTVYESYYDPLNSVDGYHLEWPRKTDERYTNWFARVDYDILDNVHFKGILGYREYQQVFATTNSTPLSLNAYLVDQEHEQYSFEGRFSGTLFDERLDWTAGGYYFESDHWYGGNVTLGTFGYVLPPFMFLNNDTQQTKSISGFAHAIYSITDELSVTAGIRFTQDEKTATVDHTDFVTVPEPFEYKDDFSDWKFSLNYEFTDDIMAYFTVATGYRSEGSVPRPWNYSQLDSISHEEIISYEVGTKMEFFNNRLRVNPSAFMYKYDPRVMSLFGAQCTDYTTNPDHGEYIFPWGSICPAGTDLEGTTGTYATVYLTAPGTAKGFELLVSARPLDALDINASYSYYEYETDVSSDHPGYVHPDRDLQAKHKYNIGAQYRVDFPNGSLLIPRLDMFYEGERYNCGVNTKPVAPYHVIPDYYLFNGRLTFVPPDSHWSLSLEAQNLFDEFYWVNLTAEMADDLSGPTFGRTGQPGRPRTVSITLRYDFF